MSNVPAAVHDPARLEAVHRTGLLDTPAEEPFDRLAALAADLLGAPYAFITLVDEKRSFWKSCIGLGDDPAAPRENGVEESFCQYVIGTGEELIVGDVRANPLTAHNPSIDLMGVAAWAGFPVHAPTGEVLGTFCVVDVEVRDWQPRAVDILRVLSLAAATEIEVRLLLDDERAARRAADSETAETALRYGALLAAASEGIYGLDRQGRTTFLNRAAEDLLGYDATDLLGREQHAAIHHSHSDGRPAAVEQCRIRHCLDTGEQQESAAGEVFWRRDGTSFPVAYTASPVRSGDLVTGAVVTFVDLTDRLERGRLEVEAAELRAARVAERAALLELQQTMQPAPLGLTGVELGACYRPADGAAAGGDLYDWLPLPDGTLHLSIVDVVGKGVAAAKDAMAVTHALRLLTLSGTPIGEVVQAADVLLCQSFPDLAATVLVARFDPTTGALQLADGGHPPALLVPGGADSAARYLDAEGRAIGWPEAGSEGVLDVELPIGGSLVMFTDGLVEAQRDILQGLDDLGHAASARSGLATVELAEALVSQCLDGADRVDDALVVVLRRTAAGQSSRAST